MTMKRFLSESSISRLIMRSSPRARLRGAR
jgi:hypothetical protein